MARMPRAKEFLIEPARLTEDNDTIRLSLSEWGAYSRIFLRAWHQPECPGVIPAVDTVLASMAGCLDPAEWNRIRTVIEPLFDTGSRPGFWIAQGLVETHERQTAFVKVQRAKGIASGKARRARRSNRGSDSVQTAVEPTLEPPSVLGSRFSVKEESTPTHSGHPAPPSDRREVEQLALDPSDPNREETEREWVGDRDSGFEELWRDYPNKLGKAEALKAWKKLRPRTQAHLDVIWQGFEFYKRRVWCDRPPDKIERMSTWINNARYRDGEEAISR